ncbi:Fur family transcriptional regulator [Limnovirga soli]|uniref:Transcriptional repressor n=1 Tax=Limnovirga soli TaxID=2656915 RepID=A0A8J8JT90_9BACT|nr:transcriptional repressor [Limnovirga soli]NNV57797.1 transcriptional repressor [Limnovirga soli]
MSNELENMLIAKQITPTPMRVMVLEYILNQTTAISLNDLENEFQHSDRITIYRTVKTFEEKGLIHDIRDGNEGTKYALCDKDCTSGVHYDMHLHFYCTSCKELMCLPKEDMPVIKLPDSFQLQEVSFVARGICDTCSNNAIQLH